MKKTVFHKIRRLFRFTLLVCLSLGILSAKAQTARVTLKVQNASLGQVMDEIKNQTRYLFINQDVKDLNNHKVSLNVSDKAIAEVLDQIFTPFNIGYRIEKTSIIIFNRPKSTSSSVLIGGKVSDVGGAPIIGATVLVKGTTNGVSTDADGRFTLTIASPATAQLEISYLGYEPQTLAVGNRTSFEITLAESASEIESVVVTALGIKREEKALSYNVQQVEAEDITTVKDANFMNSLTGKVAGVTINASSSGVGGASKVVLRGNKSISQSSNALYVIDGIPMYNFGGGGGTEFDSKGATEAIADINPEDIESISVLTGAAAAALYGSNAANGAVMITTKKGQAGALKVTLSSNTEFLNPFVQPEFQNRYGTGLNGLQSGSAIYSWGEKLAPAARLGYTPDDFFETGHVYTNAVTVSGGTDKNQTYFSAASVNSDGIIPNNEYDRYNFTFRNTSYFLKDKLRLDASASYIYQQDQNMTNQGVYSNPLVPAYLFPRGTNFDSYRIFERYNPASKLMEQFWSDDLERSTTEECHRRPRTTACNASYRCCAGCGGQSNKDFACAGHRPQGRVRIDNANSLYTQKLYASSNTTITDGGKNGHYTEQREYDTQTYADIMVNINKTFGDDWSLQANVGASINNVKIDQLSYRGPIQENGLPNVFNVFDLDDSKKRAEKYGWQEQTQSIFASVEVGWKQMLYLTLTGRNDWASQLANSPQSSFFYPSVGLSWVPTSLWDMGNALTYLKIRGSIASVGMPFPRHLTVPTYEYDATNKVWTAKTHYPIGDLYPERTRTYELGLDARLWKHFSLSASWYWADTYNQTFDPQISVSSGYSTIYLQTGHVRNTGVEASLGYQNQWRDFGWSTNFTFSWNKNEIVELVHNYVHPETGELITKERLEIKGLGKAKYILKPGGTLGDLYTNSDLVYNDDGYIEVDKNGNVAVKDDYMDDIYLGSVFPKYNLAWRNDFNYKGINLGVLFTARIGGICYSATQANMDLYGVSEASAAARDAGGVMINGRDMIDAQKWYQVIGSQSGLPQYYTYSATNVRLQELSLGYTLPSKWFRDKMRMTVSFVGRNLWMIYCKAPFDPEAVASTGMNYQGIDYFMMPSMRNLGFNVKFQF